MQKHFQPWNTWLFLVGAADFAVGRFPGVDVFLKALLMTSIKRLSSMSEMYFTLRTRSGSTINVALPSQRNNFQEGRQISTDSYNYNWDNPKNIKGLQ
jgi:hypothetical protein